MPGDIILEFNHIPIDDDGQLVNVVSMTDIGSTVPVLGLPQPPDADLANRGPRSREIPAVGRFSVCGSKGEGAGAQFSVFTG